MLDICLEMRFYLEIHPNGLAYSAALDSQK